LQFACPLLSLLSIFRLSVRPCTVFVLRWLISNRSRTSSVMPRGFSAWGDRSVSQSPSVRFYGRHLFDIFSLTTRSGYKYRVFRIVFLSQPPPPLNSFILVLLSKNAAWGNCPRLWRHFPFVFLVCQLFPVGKLIINIDTFMLNLFMAKIGISSYFLNCLISWSTS